jgi:hypothetical protein
MRTREELNGFFFSLCLSLCFPPFFLSFFFCLHCLSIYLSVFLCLSLARFYSSFLFCNCSSFSSPPFCSSSLSYYQPRDPLSCKGGKQSCFALTDQFEQSRLAAMRSGHSATAAKLRGNLVIGRKNRVLCEAGEKDEERREKEGKEVERRRYPRDTDEETHITENHIESQTV